MNIICSWSYLRSILLIICIYRENASIFGSEPKEPRPRTVEDKKRIVKVRSRSSISPPMAPILNKYSPKRLREFSDGDNNKTWQASTNLKDLDFNQSRLLLNAFQRNQNKNENKNPKDEDECIEWIKQNVCSWIKQNKFIIGFVILLIIGAVTMAGLRFLL